MKPSSPRFAFLMAIIILQFVGFSQPTHAAATSQFFQGEALPQHHPLVNFHLIYDPKIDFIYFNIQKIDIIGGGNRIEATSIARQIRRSYLAGRLQNDGERYLAHLEGVFAKRHHESLVALESNCKSNVADPAASRAWNERNAESMMPTNKKVASYQVLSLEPFQEPIDIDWKKYLPHCSVSVPRS